MCLGPRGILPVCVATCNLRIVLRKVKNPGDWPEPLDFPTWRRCGLWRGPVCSTEGPNIIVAFNVGPRRFVTVPKHQSFEEQIARCYTKLRTGEPSFPECCRCHVLRKCDRSTATNEPISFEIDALFQDQKAHQNSSADQEYLSIRR